MPRLCTWLERSFAGFGFVVLSGGGGRNQPSAVPLTIPAPRQSRSRRGNEHRVALQANDGNDEAGSAGIVSLPQDTKAETESRQACQRGSSDHATRFSWRLSTMRFQATPQATAGTIAHWSSGASPVPQGGSLGIAEVYVHDRHTSTFHHSLNTV